ncbi:galactokinase family protein [Conexibacter sp. DBS9H8]|uniref:galactokinase n=1 Tax=Conexibacter sp. DBS9H8 TaxID=2937801 RepID=UPI00200F2AE1|nr:galactokinase family protein [Conexibacter sp. DBS9H8]
MARAEAVAFAPGRVNLIGEHTDYNGGLALPFAISAGVQVTARAAVHPGEHVVWALDIAESDRFSAVTGAPAPTGTLVPTADPGPAPAGGWRAFTRGMVAELAAAGITVPAAEIEITGTVPRGRGLSSSAALEVALAYALCGLADTPLPDPIALARLCARVEHDWVGAQSGLLDQLASICGRPGTALLIDFRGPTLTPVPLTLDGYTLVAVDSGEDHRLATSGYNDRREECRQACRALGVASLTEATLEQAATLPEPLGRRARHVIGENDRVRAAVAALSDRDLPRLGALLNASHASLRDDYEVSTPAVEATVTALMHAGAVGARLVGGGFGGSVLALLEPSAPTPAGALVLEAGPGARRLDPDGERPAPAVLGR